MCDAIVENARDYGWTKCQKDATCKVTYLSFQNKEQTQQLCDKHLGVLKRSLDRQKIRKDAQEMVDKITLRIVELQDSTAGTDKVAGFKIPDGKEKTETVQDNRS